MWSLIHSELVQMAHTAAAAAAAVTDLQRSYQSAGRKERRTDERMDECFKPTDKSK